MPVWYRFRIQELTLIVPDLHYADALTPVDSFPGGRRSLFIHRSFLISAFNCYTHPVNDGLGLNRETQW